MPFVAAPVKIPEDIHHILSKFSKSRTLPARQVQRAKIILLAADGMNNMQISTRVGPGQDSVSKWRGRFLKALPLLQEIAEKDRSHLEDAVSSFLNDRLRPGQQPIWNLNISVMERSASSVFLMLLQDVWKNHI